MMLWFAALCAAAVSGAAFADAPTARSADSPAVEIKTASRQADSACEREANVDTCWRAGVAAEKAGDARKALAAYDRSCDAGFQLGGCYEAGKIYFLDRSLRDYRAANTRLARVCASDDVGIGPYACKFVGILYRDRLVAGAGPDRAFQALSRACFLHNDAPFIDGSGCEVLAGSVPTAAEMAVSGDVWHRDYIAYLALVMGCSDAMPSLCEKAEALHRRAAAQSARWVRLCADELSTIGFSGTCPDLVKAAATPDFDRRQATRRQLVRLFRNATEYSG